MADKDQDKIRDILFEKEEQALVIRLATSANITSLRLDEYIQIRLLNGATREDVKAELTKDLMEGGRIFGEFRRSIKATAHGNIRRISDMGQWAFEGVQKFMRWVTVEDKDVCEDCQPRHNQSKTHGAWEVLGLPRSGWSICKDNCRCVLVDSELELPVIKRERK